MKNKYYIIAIVILAIIVILVFREPVERKLMEQGLIGDFKYFKYSEFDSPDMPGSGEKYMNKDFIKMLDKARGMAGVPFKINSGYRTTKRNEDVGGVADSAHTKGLAVDISTTPETKKVILDSLLKVGFVRVGIGNNFIHVDNDKSKPQYVAWAYTSTGTKPISFPPNIT